MNPGLIVGHDLTIVSMIMNASVVVKAVMAMLVIASVLSWTYIFMKMFAIRRARHPRAGSGGRHRRSSACTRRSSTA